MKAATTIPKIITLWQPWATLLAAGVKQYETRPSHTSWRGTYLIHAAKVMPTWVKRLCLDEPFLTALIDLGFGEVSELPLGAIVGSFRVDYCMSTDQAKPMIEAFSDTEIAFGDYSPGRWAWKAKDVRIAKTPISCSGGQGYYLNYKGDLSLVADLLHPEPVKAMQVTLFTK